MTSEQNNTPIFDIAIVGAGLAGSLCAHLLSTSGQSVCVIDKSRGSGGRASSKRLKGDVSCDLGAFYVHAKHPNTKALFDRLLNDKVVAPWPALDTTNASAFVGVPKMSSITRHLLGETHFITNTRVHHLDQTSSHWLLRDERYQPIVLAKKIIITAPAPQSAAILSTHSALSSLLETTNQACEGYQSQWAMWLETNASEADVLIEPQNTPIKRIIKDSDKAQRQHDGCDRWVIQADPDWTKQHLDDDKNDIAAALLEAFTSNTHLNITRHGEPHRWFLSRFFANKTHNATTWSAQHNAGIAGDWLCQGDAEGALLSALTLIQQMKDAQ
ncbi:NAD(P)-binding protein [Marinomonas sp. A79]|uniref:NAD(P)-binding protein n=1 Tax=Marinomonas vulgaris TaxID=2823372 RepID=A0ABS5HAQ4_9GAMM|nr:NAD(P)-binding protein [Marinomonas vulgaris]MBR7888751.1 NAD(P)-binding protein [Marinomonas vulgaris]